MKCDITLEDGVLLIRLSGAIQNDDLLELLRLVQEAESRTPATPPRLTDLSGLTELRLTFAGMNDVVRLRKGVTFPNSFKSAIVAPELAQFGFARMFQTLNDHRQIEIKVFRDLPSARDWLAYPKVVAQ
jgi:hypothetical protein